jgi:capsular exopolysaccharide synthesis family protein
MGRVYDALRKGRDSQPPRIDSPTNRVEPKRNLRSVEMLDRDDEYDNDIPDNGQPRLWARQSTEPSFEGSAVFQPSSSVSASTEQTDTLTGQALPGDKASRTAGATLGAAGSTFGLKFASREIEPTSVEPHFVAVTQPRSGYCEEYRSLRTHVLHASRKRKMQTIVIASVGAGEGKSMTALNLSWLMAQTEGVRTLVIDSDLRHPCLHDYLGIEAPVGLSDIFSDRATLEAAIIRLEPAGLHLLPGGRARDDVAEVLSGPRFTVLLEQARKLFDFIIIDAPPLGIFTDATVLINQSDGALLIVRAGKTRYGLVDRLLDTLPRERMLGVVVNRNQERSHESLDYYSQRERERYGQNRSAYI